MKPFLQFVVTNAAVWSNNHRPLIRIVRDVNDNTRVGCSVTEVHVTSVGIYGLSVKSNPVAFLLSVKK